MTLKSLQLCNFKSYKGDAEVPFDGKPFVTVVGPNGSGKSNMLDATCFVVGLTPEQLRCHDLNALVHKGNKKLAMHVTARVDKADGTPVVLKRTPTTFEIDGRVVSHEEYTAKWSELNVLPSARNVVVFQGDIEKLAGGGPKDLAELIESMQQQILGGESSGNAEYAAMESELAAATVSARKLATSRRTALAQADQSMELSQARTKLDDLKEQLKSLEQRKAKLEKRERLAVRKRLRKEVRNAKQQVTNYQEEASLADSDAKKLRAEFARKRRMLQNARSAETAAKEAVNQTEAILEPIVRKIDSINAEKRLLEPEIEFGEQSVAAAEEEIKAAKKSIRLLQRTYKLDESKRHEYIEFSELSPELRDMWSTLDSEFISETALLQDELRSLKRESVKIAQRVSLQEHQREDKVTELNAVQSKVKDCQQRVQQLTSMVEECNTQQKTYRAELSNVSDELLSVRAEQRDYGSKMTDLNVKIRAADGNKRALAQRHKLLDAVERMRRNHAGVFDLLGSLVEPTDAKYQVAVGRALGVSMDAIVVDTAETAIACIEHSNAERLGQFRFLPIASMKHRDLSSARAQIAHQASRGNDVKLLMDCIKYEARFRPAIVQAIGNTAIVPEFEVGLKLRKLGLKMRFVVEDGAIIATSNIVSTSTNTGALGGSSQRALALLQRNLINVSEKLKIAQAREIELTDDEVRFNSDLNRAMLTIKGAEQKLVVAEEQLSSAKKTADHLQETIKTQDAQLMKASEEFVVAEAKLNEKREVLQTMREAKFSGFVEEAGDTLDKWDSLFAKGAQRLYELTRQGQRLQDRLQLATEKRSAACTQLKQHQDRAKALEQVLEQSESQRTVTETELTSNNMKLDRAKARLASARVEAEAKSDEVGMAEGNVDAAKDRLTCAERDVTRHTTALSTELNVNPNSDDADMSTSDLSSDEEMHDDEIEEEEGDSRRGKRKRAAGIKKTPADRKQERVALNIDRLDTRISSLKAEIDVLVRVLGSRSADAEDEERAIRASQLCNALKETAESARAKQDELATKFNQLRKHRAAMFISGLNRLQSILSSVYAELVGNDSQAKLSIIDSEKPFEGVEFTVMPPGKPFTRVSQLSGGERSMAALALLFTCQTMHPAPFIVLDEVDAALDFANVANLAKYIRTHSLETQFITISLKQRLFQTASDLVGVYKEKVSSQILTVPI